MSTSGLFCCWIHRCNLFSSVLHSHYTFVFYSPMILFLFCFFNPIYEYHIHVKCRESIYMYYIKMCATASDIGSSTVSFCTCCEQIQHRQSMDFLNIKQPVSDREWLTLSIDFHSMLFHPSIVFLRWYLHRLCCYWKLDKSIGLGNCIIYRQSFQDELESINFVA